MTSSTYSSYTCAATLNWASSYQLVGATSPSSLLNGTATLLYNTNNSNVVYAALTSGASANTGTLSSGANVPSGYYAMSNGDTPWLVTNSYACSQQPAVVNDTQTGLPASSVNGTSCTYYLLLHGSPDQALQLASVTQGQGTEYEVNPSSDGTDPGTQFNVTTTTNGVSSTASEPLNVTYLTAGDTVSYTVNSSKEVTVVNETNVNDQVGRVSSTYCVTGCDNSISTGATPQIVVNVNGTAYTLNIQPYTTLTLNGKAATLSSSLDNTVAYVAVAGGYGSNTSGPANVGTGDGNAVSIALYQNQVSGTVSSISTSSSASNICATGVTTGCNVNGVTSFVLNGTTYSTDGNFSGALSPGGQATIALDSSGEARAVVSTNAVTTPTVGIVTGTGSTQTFGTPTPTETVTINGTSYGLTNNNGGVAYGGVGTTGQTVFNGVYYTGSVNGSTTPDLADLTTLPAPQNNGAVLFEVSNGVAVGPGGSGTLPTPMSLVTPIGNANGTANCWVIADTSSATATLQGESGCGTSSATPIAGDYLTVVLGTGFNNGGSSEAFTSLAVGDVAVLYSGTANGDTFYAVIDSGTGPTTVGTAQ